MNTYNPELCKQANEFYKQGKYEEALTLSLELHDLAVKEAKDNWDNTINNPTELFKQMKIWDTTSQTYMNYKDYCKNHNWKDDIAPAPLHIAAKSLHALIRLTTKNDPLKTINYLTQIKQINCSTNRDEALLKQLLLHQKR